MPDRARGLCLLIVASLPMLLHAHTVQAAPPFVTDDADIVETKHVEITLGSGLTHYSGEDEGSVVGAEVDYGLAKHLEVDASLPLGFEHGASGRHLGIGDGELALKWQFIDGADWHWLPSVALSPTLGAPTGNQKMGFGSGHMHAFLPVWLSKDFGKFGFFGGGGYGINPGRSNRDWLFVGAGAVYRPTKRWNVGGETYFTSATTTGCRNQESFDLSVIYDASEVYHVYVLAGRGLIGAASNNMVSATAGLQITL